MILDLDLIDLVIAAHHDRYRLAVGNKDEGLDELLGWKFKKLADMLDRVLPRSIHFLKGTARGGDRVGRRHSIGLFHVGRVITSGTHGDSRLARLREDHEFMGKTAADET